MRFNPREITGSRARLHYSVELHYEVSGPADFILCVHAAKTACQSVVDEAFLVTPEEAYALNEEPVFGNRLATFSTRSPRLSARYTATVDVVHRVSDPEGIDAEGPSALPAATVRYLHPSRYCQSDLLSQDAWNLFGQMPRNYAQVRTVRDWVRNNIGFQVGTSHPGTSAVDTLRTRTGICRDFAHVMIAYCRALNYPARIATGVDYGADPALGPPDFHAYVEVYIGDTWYMFDPTGISPITGLLRIATGRDAADVSFATIFGPVGTGMPIVTCSASADPAAGIGLPESTELAVSTTD